MSDHRTQEAAATGDSYDLALGLRRRLADAIRPETGSVASQLQSAARERLGSGERIQKGRGRSSRRRRVSPPDPRLGHRSTGRST